MGNNAPPTATEATGANEGIDTKVIEVLMIVFGIVVGSGFDTFLDFKGEWKEREFAGALLYWMGISVVARLSFGGALHLHIEYGPGSTWENSTKRRLALFWDVAFFFAFAMILRYAAALETSVSFFVGQTLLFATALGWGCVTKRFLENPFKRGDWSFWSNIDGANLVVAALAVCLLHVPGYGERTNGEFWVLGVAAILYGVIGVWELRCLLAAADNARVSRGNAG